MDSEHVERAGLPACQLRRRRRCETGDAWEIICLAAGGQRLALEGDDETPLQRACADCPIPAALRGDRQLSCLHLRPVRFFEPEAIKTYFPVAGSLVSTPSVSPPTTGCAPAARIGFPAPIT